MDALEARLTENRATCSEPVRGTRMGIVWPWMRGLVQVSAAQA
jgi:hypothetical protein